jgi:hypothetical protein
MTTRLRSTPEAQHYIALVQSALPELQAGEDVSLAFDAADLAEWVQDRERAAALRAPFDAAIARLNADLRPSVPLSLQEFFP